MLRTYLSATHSHDHVKMDFDARSFLLALSFSRRPQHLVHKVHNTTFMDLWCWVTLCTIIYIGSWACTYISSYTCMSEYVCMDRHIFVFASSSRFSIRVSCQVRFPFLPIWCMFLLHAFCIWRLCKRTEAHKPCRHSLLPKSIQYSFKAMANERENGAERKKLVYTHWHSPEWAGERTKRSEENILYFLLLSAFHWSKTVNFVRQKPRVEQSEIPFEKVAKSHESVWKSRKTVWKKSEPSYLSWYIKDDEARQRCKCKMFYYDGPYAICTTT